MNYKFIELKLSKMMNCTKYIIAFCLLLSFAAKAQEILPKQGAVDIALEYNYDIKVSNNELEAAKNSSSIYNSGYLPSIFAQGGTNYNDEKSEIAFVDGRVQDNIEQTTTSYNASVGVDYVIFDGLGRRYSKGGWLQVKMCPLRVSLWSSSQHGAVRA